jgi:oligoendopeptidase F
MFETLPKSAHDFMDWDWAKIEPYIDDLIARDLNADNINQWLVDWTSISELLSERFSRLQVASTVDTTDEKASQQLNDYLDNIFPQSQEANQQIQEKLLESGLRPDNFEIPLRNIEAEVELFREENLPLQTQSHKLGQEYDRITGAQAVEWDGEERTLAQLKPYFQDADRSVREKVWRLSMERGLQDRKALNELWVKFLNIRQEIADNAGFDSYRDYVWQEYLRFDYTPDDCMEFHRAIEEVVVPAASRLYDKRRQRLGTETLRPWDLDVDPIGHPALRPFKDTEDMEARCEAMFKLVDPELGSYFSTMRQEKLLDLANRKGKAPGGYCTSFDVERKPFIFMNAVGLHDDVQTMLHEAGHAFHVFESSHLPYAQQLMPPMEFAEVASMSMELIAAPYLVKDKGGFYSDDDAARARVEHLEGIVRFWPYMAVVDAFQHWVYENIEDAKDSKKCDAKWGELWDRFMKGIDYSGLDEEKVTGWHRKLHIFHIPFYYVEYGLAQLGAVQVWRNSLSNQAGALQNYRKALSLGGTVTLPELFSAAGAKFAFDPQTMNEAVELVENTITELDPA